MLGAIQRLFTAGRLARRFAFVSLMMGMVLAVLIGVSLYLVSSRYLIRQHHANVEANAALVARQTEGQLATLVNTVRELSASGMLAAAIVDSTGKAPDLLPFLHSFGHIASVPVSLVFAAADGRPIADNGQRADLLRMTATDRAWLERAVTTGRPVAAVLEDGGHPYLLGAEMPVRGTVGTPGRTPAASPAAAGDGAGDGALFYKVLLSSLVLHPEARLLHAGGLAPPVPDGRMAFDVGLVVPDRLLPLGLLLRLEAPAAPTAAFQSWVLPAYGLIAVMALTALYFGSRAVGSHMTRSLRQLERLAGMIVSDGFTGQRAQIRGDDEVSRLSQSFNTMLDHIAAIQHERELRAMEEITIQRTLATRAEQARTEAESAKNEAERARQEAIMALMVAERANAAKTHFLAAASHDLRQPVQSLVLLTSALASRLADHPASSLVGSIEASMDALCRLLDAILDMSKLDAGTVSPNVQVVSLGAIFERLEGEYRLRAAEKGIGFRSVPNSLTLGADPALLERIIRNLVENALRYTDRGRILLGCRRGPRTLRIQVYDTGIGIPPEHLERIFHEFYQVANPSRDRGKGLGLGLAIVDRLARLLGYRVLVASWPGKGSCFTLEIDDPALLTLPEAVAAPEVPMLPAANMGTALVIDDDPLVREGLRLLIESFGWLVLAADGAPSALRLLAESRRNPDLVIADYRLAAGATGLEAIRAVEATVTNAPQCVVLTGDTAPQRIADAEASGYRILHKPIAAKDIAQLLNETAGSGPADTAEPVAGTAERGDQQPGEKARRSEGAVLIGG